MAILGGEFADTRNIVRTFSFGKTEINKDTTRSHWIVEKVGRLNVAMEDMVLMNGLKCGEQASEVQAHVGHSHVAEIIPKVAMLAVWKDSDDLVCVAESSDERANRIGVAQVV